MGFHNIFRYVSIHPTLMLFFFIAFITGTFVQLSIILLIVIIHELGHFIAARHYKWRIDSIVLWAFGGVMKTDENTTRPLKEEIIVTIAGPLQHVMIYFFILFFSYFNLLPPHMIEQAIYFNVIILLFNLLPIYPLDGGKIYLFILSIIIPYRLAYRMILIFSFVTCFIIVIAQLTIFIFTFSAILLIIFLMVEIYKYWRDEYYTFIRFLLHRLYTGKTTYKVKHIYVHDNERLLDIFNQFKRNKYHYIYVTSQLYIDETESLKRFFYDRNYNETVKEIFIEQ